MKIGVDIREAAHRRTGKGMYVYHLLHEIFKLDHANQYLLYTNHLSGALAEMLSGSNQNVHLKMIDRAGLRFHLAVVADFKRERGDVFFAPTSFIIPALLPNHIRSVITVHDLIAFLFPKFHHTRSTIIERLFFRRALKKTHRVLVPSQNTKRDLVALFHYDEERVNVTPLAASSDFFEPLASGVLQKVRDKYALPETFVLAVSGLEPRKNVALLLQILPELVSGAAGLKLVIVGGKGWKSAQAEGALAKQAANIIHIEHCEPQELPAMYRLAALLAYPSHYEGFGLPPLEAMASGCPVVCSNASSLPEVCGNAAILLPPADTELWSSNISKLLHNPELRKQLAEKGRQRAAEFSWRKTAELTLDAFNNV